VRRAPPKPARNRFAPHSVLRDFFKNTSAPHFVRFPPNLRYTYA
jgi:hypothetical protein